MARVVKRTYQEPYKLSIGGETGFIRRALIEQYVPEPKSALFYFAGPPPMIGTMHALLEELGIVEEAMRYEEF